METPHSLDRNQKGDTAGLSPWALLLVAWLERAGYTEEKVQTSLHGSHSENTQGSSGG